MIYGHFHSLLPWSNLQIKFVAMGRVTFSNHISTSWSKANLKKDTKVSVEPVNGLHEYFHNHFA